MPPDEPLLDEPLPDDPLGEPVDPPGVDGIVPQPTRTIGIKKADITISLIFMSVSNRSTATLEKTLELIR